MDGRNWYQQEFSFEFDAVPKKKKKVKVDYELIYNEMKQHGPLTFSQIEALAGVNHSGVAQVITTLSLHYPVYEVKRGLYKLYGDDDYGDGINHDALKGKEDYCAD